MKEKGSGVKKKNLSRDTLFILCDTLIACVLLLGAAVAPLTEGTAFVVRLLALIVSGLPVCVQLVLGMRDKTRIPAGFLMVVVLAVMGVSGALADAAAAAVLYNLCTAGFDRLTQKELNYAADRLSRRIGRAGNEGTDRLNHVMGELTSYRVKALITDREREYRFMAATLVLTALIGLIPPFLDGWDFPKWIGRGLAILVLCLYRPDISTIMTYLNAAETAFEEGIWFSGTGPMTAASEVTSVVFNKTGTLTEGELEVVGVESPRLSEEQLLYLAACAQLYSDHPTALAIKRRFSRKIDPDLIVRHRTQPGYGSVAKLSDGNIVMAGNIELMERMGVQGDFYTGSDTSVFVAVGRSYVGRIDFSDCLKGGAGDVASALKKEGVANVALMTGDNALSAMAAGKMAGITEIYADCQPKDKAERLRYLLDTQESDDRLAFVTGGSGDRELLEMADISVSLGIADGQTAVFPDIIVADRELAGIPEIIRLSKALRRKMRMNDLISLGVRLVAAVLAVFGVLGVWQALLVVFATQLIVFWNTGVSGELS